MTLFRKARLEYDATWASFLCPCTGRKVVCVAIAETKLRSGTLCRSLFIHTTSNGGCHHNVQYFSTQACALAKSITRGSRISLLTAQLQWCVSASKRSCRPARAQCIGRVTFRVSLLVPYLLCCGEVLAEDLKGLQQLLAIYNCHGRPANLWYLENCVGKRSFTRDFFFAILHMNMGSLITTETKWRLL
jgi:hypothetical protein